MSQINTIQLLDLGAIALLLQRRSRRDDHVTASGNMVKVGATSKGVVPKISSSE
jgi:hypothetical protein